MMLLTSFRLASEKLVKHKLQNKHQEKLFILLYDFRCLLGLFMCSHIYTADMKIFRREGFFRFVSVSFSGNNIWASFQAPFCTFFVNELIIDYNFIKVVCFEHICYKIMWEKSMKNWCHLYSWFSSHVLLTW